VPKKDYPYRVLKRFVGRAIHRYGMIRKDDRILVGLSGGMDSLTLMWILSDLQRRAPVSYDLLAVHVDPGFSGGFSERLMEYCRKMGYRLRVEKTSDGPLAHSAENRENPCFLCSRLRRKRLFEIAEETGCNKIALGHNKDDLIQTLFINMFYAGEIGTMAPVQSFFENRFTVIRPLAYTEERTIRWFAGRQGFPAFVNPCPSAGRTKRSEIKTLLESLYRKNPKIKGNIFRSMSHVNTDYLLKK